MRHHDAPTPPPEVIQALEAVERATSPAHIGREYQILLDWRRAHPAPAFRLNLLPFLWTVAIVALVVWGASWFAATFDFELSPFWQGALFGAAITSLAFQVSDKLKHATPPTTIEERIEAAIERWRHAVPAMRELPR